MKCIKSLSGISRRRLVNAIAMASLVGTVGVTAQEQTDDALSEEVLVTGYRSSLLNSTNAKRDSNGFGDIIFADDIGKMPSQNLAESLNRIPGVKLNRDVTGEGQQITVRGLGPSFTKVVMNGNNIAVASTGTLDAGNRNREVDLDMFPTELFSSLSVAKTTNARQVEGGVSGYVDLRTLRPSDRGDRLFTFGIEGQYGELSEEISPQANLIYSQSNDTWGVLVGIVGAKNKFRVDGYEAVSQFTDGCVAEWSGDDPAGRNNSRCVDGSQGFNHFFWSPEATPDYAAANPGVAVGDPVDPVALSGLPAGVLDTAKLPYLGRPTFSQGDRDRVSGLISVEYRPNDKLELALDVLSQDASRDFVRTEAMWWGRRNYLHQGAAMIPVDVTVDEHGYVTSGTFYNAHLWAGSRDYQEDLSFLSVMPSAAWQINDSLKMNLALNFTESDFERDEPYVLYMSPGGVLTYDVSSVIPSFTFSADPADPNIGWTWQQEFDQNQNGAIDDDERYGDRFRVQRNERKTENTGVHLDFELGESARTNGVLFGLAWDENSSDIRSYGGTPEFTAEHVEGSAADENFTDFLLPSLVNDLGKNVSGYRGYTGIAQVDWARLKEATRYDEFEPIAGGGDQFGQTNGTIEEEMVALYLEANTEADLLGRPLRTNAGVRWVQTDQTVTTLTGQSEASYSRLLPSLNLVYDATDSLKLRVSGSRSLTRANPSDMYPTSSWGSSGVESINTGNPRLSPFEATNFDIGGEWYFDDLGYVGLTFFEKNITGFTRQDTRSVVFEDLVNYGVDITPEGLGSDRVAALEACGGATVCTVNVNTRENVEGTARLEGYEIIWVMPLDRWLPGLGFDTSATHINQYSDGDAEITGISDWTYNFTAFYENQDIQLRLTYFHQDGSLSFFSQGIPVRSMDRSQVDFAASYALPILTENNLTLTFDAYNLTDEPVGSWHEHEGIAFSAFYPGATYTLGLHGSF